MDLQKSLGVSDWGSEEPCEWVGVFCDLEGEVVSINIEQDFTGDLAEEIFPGFEKLRTFTIYVPESERILTVPQDFCEGGNLRQVQIRGLKLEQFPEQILECEKLEFLSLAYCGIQGELPEFSDLVNLKYVEIVGNYIEGEIPLSLTQLEQLEYVELYDNILIGEIPDFVSENLKVLDVRENQLTGKISSALFNKESIEYFGFDGNDLEYPGICEDLTFCTPFKNI